MSKVSINSLFSKIVEESAEAKDSSKEDSNLSRVTENSFYFLTSSCFYISSSFFSIFTTVASNCSSKPCSVTIKLMMVHWAAISGLKWGFVNFVIKKSLKCRS